MGPEGGSQPCPVHCHHQRAPLALYFGALAALQDLEGKHARRGSRQGPAAHARLGAVVAAQLVDEAVLRRRLRPFTDAGLPAALLLNACHPCFPTPPRCRTRSRASSAAG